MRTGTLAIIVALLALGALAATGISGTGEDGVKERSGPPVVKKGERVTRAEARAAGAVVAHRRHRFRVQYIVAARPTFVPANGITPITILTCPRRWAAIGGFFETDRAVVADLFFKPANVRRWQYGFVDVAGAPGRAREGVVCARIR